MTFLSPSVKSIAFYQQVRRGIVNMTISLHFILTRVWIILS